MVLDVCEFSPRWQIKKSKKELGRRQEEGCVNGMEIVYSCLDALKWIRNKSY